jgi:mannose-1-phosphate guanylyltransferase
VLDRIPPGERCRSNGHVPARSSPTAGLYGSPTDDYWIDAGVPELYRAANLDLLSSARRHEHADAIAVSAVVDPGATVVNSIVGAGAQVAQGARVVDSVLLDGAHIGADASVIMSLVMGQVSERATIEDVIVGADGVVAPAAELHSTTVPVVE